MILAGANYFSDSVTIPRSVLIFDAMLTLLALLTCVHPTAAGQEIVAETVWKTLRPLLAEPVKGP